jgi:hypothetical protein
MSASVPGGITTFNSREVSPFTHSATPARYTHSQTRGLSNFPEESEHREATYSAPPKLHAAYFQRYEVPRLAPLVSATRRDTRFNRPARNRFTEADAQDLSKSSSHANKSQRTNIVQLCPTLLNIAVTVCDASASFEVGFSHQTRYSNAWKRLVTVTSGFMGMKRGSKFLLFKTIPYKTFARTRVVAFEMCRTTAYASQGSRAITTRQ